ncbi:predicted protein [Histoplasma capsulatum G186AR]|uniref:Uncharacterized protein n=1 Tax=Ajellomyces capsulatus (strain G186AR / H82 / ATCC MYA-2454 / RMSCC 2432) TaxID=447093 RepID=C0NVF4_AJECG|nr:uncharacterized protein HCBG_07134 [Histoplasma capsulatum G186AR]EEH04493.1 predicted protein [Histoplasma capsulatum G186AR]
MDIHYGSWNQPKGKDAQMESNYEESKFQDCVNAPWILALNLCATGRNLQEYALKQFSGYAQILVGESNHFGSSHKWREALKINRSAMRVIEKTWEHNYRHFLSHDDTLDSWKA